jgi:hypothetical protein
MSRPVRDQIKLYEVMLLIAGLALGLWLVMPVWKRGEGLDIAGGSWLMVCIYVLGGLSLVGPPLLLWERRRNGRTWGAGRFVWFSHGTASWLLWPPIIYSRARGNRSDTEVCALYGTPLMAVYVTSALLFGGWLRKRRRRVMMRSWREQFGLGLALAWACIGLYFLSLFYYEDFRR